MNAQWKEGDVVVIDFVSGPERAMWVGGEWVVTGGRSRASNYLVARPLVVIDPEVSEQVERLMTRYAVQRALREFASPTPPKPEEPTGLGAVVEDDKGVQWVRAGASHQGRLTDTWRCSRGEQVGWWSRYADIAAVRVLSEGVEVDR